MGRAHGDRGPRALIFGAEGPWRVTLRTLATGIGIVAFLALHHVARQTGVVLREAADVQAAHDAAGYLTAIAPPRAGRRGPDPRLLSAAASLQVSSFWTGGLQVWLDGAPLLGADPAALERAAVPLPGLEGAPRGSVTAWHTVPDPGVGAIDLWTALLLVILLSLVGTLIPRGRVRRLLLVLLLAGLGLAVTDRVRSVARTDRAVVDAGLLRARRMLETTAAGRRLPEAAVASMTTGRRVLAVTGTAVAARDTLVTRDSLGANVLATGARRQTWRLVAPPTELGGTWRLLFLLGVVVMAGAGLAGALPPGAGYLKSSLRTPPTDP